jgi:hypothetical protein
LTLELAHVPEKQALEIILRTVPGYMVAQRATSLPGGSQFDRIVVMPGTVAPPSRAAAAPPLTPPPPQTQPQPMPAMVEDQDSPVQEAPDQVGAGNQQEEQPPHQPPTLAQPGFQPMPPPNPNQQGQPDQEGAQEPAGPVSVPSKGAVVSPTPGQLPLPPQPKPPEQ